MADEQMTEKTLFVVVTKGLTSGRTSPLTMGKKEAPAVERVDNLSPEKSQEYLSQRTRFEVDQLHTKDHLGRFVT